MLPPRNVLIFHQAALGDFIVTWPLALAVSRLFPQSRVAYVTSADKGKLAERVLGVESLSADAGWHALYQPGATPDDAICRRLEDSHLILSFVADEAGEWATNAARLASRARVVCLSTKAHADDHAAAQLLPQLSQWPDLHEASRQMLAGVWRNGIGNIWKPAGNAPVLLHPGAGGKSKRWPVACFCRLAEALRGRGIPVRAVIGEAERDERHFPPADLARLRSAVDVRSCETLPELLAAVSSASVFIGNDSGPGHLAAIVGVPTVALFVGGDPARWQPIGPRVKVIAADAAAAIAAETVLDAAIASFAHRRPSSAAVTDD